MKVSLVIATYNRVDALQAVLQSVMRQTVLPSEVLVADDGSRPDTAAAISALAADFPCPLRHVWQEDRGFRLASIRNRAVTQAQGDYLIFLDGDCLLRPVFIANHMRLAQTGWAVAGQRVLLSAAYTQAVLAGKADVSWSALLRGRWRGDVNRLLPLLTLPDGAWRRLQRLRWQLLRGCNIAVWRSDFMAVNGFDERFNGWGYEDSDFAIRLIRAGVGIKNGRFATAVLHLWHKENDRSHEHANHALLQETLHGSHTRAVLGVAQYGEG